MLFGNRNLLTIIILIAVTANSFAADPPVPKKTRQLAIDVTEMRDGNYDDAFQIAKSAAFMALKSQAKASGW